MLTFNPEIHEYKLEGIKLPSVTQIIEGAGLSDFSMVNQEVLRKAQLFGTATHLATSLDDRNQLDMKSLDPTLLPYLNAWRKFKKDFNITEFAEIEKQVYSKRYQYAGCLDRLWGDTLLEIKTCTVIPKTTGLQLAGYLIAFNEGKKFNEKVKIKKRLCVQLKEGMYKIETFTDRIDTSVFLSCLNLYNWKKLIT